MSVLLRREGLLAHDEGLLAHDEGRLMLAEHQAELADRVEGPGLLTDVAGFPEQVDSLAGVLKDLPRVAPPIPQQD
jgi:hypothetical protein